MIKVSCINCGHGYRVKDKLKGKTLKCPHCGMPIEVTGEKKKGEVSEQDMRSELMRLAGASATDDDSAGTEDVNDEGGGGTRKGSGTQKRQGDAQKRKSSEPADEDVGGVQSGPELEVEPARKDYTGLVVGLVVLMIVGLGGVFGYVRYQSYQQKRKTAKARETRAIEKALAAAKELDDPCAREEAAEAWLNVRDLARDYEQEYADEKFLDVITMAGNKVQNLRGAMEKRSSTMRRMDSLLAQSKRNIEQENYQAARSNLEKAVQLGESLDCRGEEAERMLATAEERLESEAVRYGGKGWVQYQGKWMPPEKKEQLVAKAREQKMKEKGLVKYKGEWMEPEQRERLVAQEKERREMARRRAEAQEAVQEQISQGVEEVLLDTGTGPLRWSGEDWANPVDVKVESAGEEAGKYVTCRLKKGSKDKWVVSLPQRCDVRPYDELRVDIISPETVKLAVGVWTLPDYKLHEGRPQSVKTAESPKTVAFKLDGKIFKSKKSKWRFTTAIEDPDKVYKLSLFFYRRAEQPIRFRNVRLVKKAEKAGE